MGLKLFSVFNFAGDTTNDGAMSKQMNL
jgi:hypothetical protein